MNREEEYQKFSEWRNLGFGHSIMPSSEVLVMAMKYLRPITREQVKKMRGEWKWQGPCRDNQGKSWATCSVCGARQRLGDYGAFCPACGSPMIDKAVDILWKRLDAMPDRIVRLIGGVVIVVSCGQMVIRL